MFSQKYELEISQLEKERGYNVTFVKPEVGECSIYMYHAIIHTVFTLL